MGFPVLNSDTSALSGEPSSLTTLTFTGLKIYADVHRKAKNGEGYRITYTTDGVTFKHVDSFTEIPVNAGDKLFVDVLPLHHTDGVIELLRRGVEVYYLRRLTLIRKKREELKLPKTTRGDIKVLSSLEERWFRRVSEDFCDEAVDLRPQDEYEGPHAARL